MAKKDRSFASKVAKGTQEKTGKHCPQCGDLYSTLFVVSTEKSNIKSWKFKEKHVNVCKCNHSEVYA